MDVLEFLLFYGDEVVIMVWEAAFRSWSIDACYPFVSF
ncbi:hypothetical protein SLEP1_g14117 [Rubroshorea leprosula]|uniref:Uncharacterized protein n=1 Tax=Rubroshorea leprosula TaxID=152421 RepID=A0AAV5IMH5_9ROSI|nr:hypothetical protein SLEP1_g14117 [Rubroshorea leprosula]